MFSIKFSLIVLQHLVIFTLTTELVLGSSLKNTEICPITSSSETGEPTWLLHGSPPKCYAAGSQGPCEPTEVLNPIHPNSNKGICVPVPVTEPKPDVEQKVITQSKKKRQTKRRHERSANASPEIVINSCPEGYYYSDTLARCRRSRSSSQTCQRGQYYSHLRGRCVNYW
ncbi:unnamed protein product [Orchesella dallaii]|uniref:Chitin-binding type-2 domain-containing protein n=1 Tax=Orchesella dallaii TaxID=48710 RepID=A0ABP1PP16_9HEXA